MQSVFRVRDYRAAGDDDGAQPLQRAIDAARRKSKHGGMRGCTVVLDNEPPWPLRSTVNVFDVKGLRIVGPDSGTELEWDGLPWTDTDGTEYPQPVFLCEDTDSCVFETLAIRRAGNKPFFAGFMLRRGTSPTRITSACRFVDLEIGNYSAGAGVHGLALTADGPGGSGNNDLHVCERVKFLSYTGSAVYVHAGQAHRLKFKDVEMTGRGSPYGIWCRYGCYLTVNGWTGGDHSISDFNLQEFFTGPCVLRGVNSEKSRKLLLVHVGGITSASCPVQIEHLRWNGTPENDGVVIFGQGRGPLRLLGVSVIRSLGDHNPRVVWWAPQDAPGVVIHEGVHYQGPEPWVRDPMETRHCETHQRGITYETMA